MSKVKLKYQRSTKSRKSKYFTLNTLKHTLLPVCIMMMTSLVTVNALPGIVINADTKPKGVSTNVSTHDEPVVASNNIRGRGIAIKDVPPPLEELPDVSLPIVKVDVEKEVVEKINIVEVEAPVMNVGEMNIQGFKTTSLGTFKVSAFCGCKVCKANWTSDNKGMRNYEGVNIAVDSSIIPFGTMVMIDGVGIRQAQPSKQTVVGNEIKVYVSNHEKVKAFGVKELEVKKVV